MKAGLTLLGILTIMWLQVIPAEAAQLRHIRIGEHKTFTRIIFEFDGHVRFQEPVIKGKGRFSIVFFDSVTTEALPFQKLRERTKRVSAVEFIHQEPHLTANVTLSSPDFKLNFFSLFSPDQREKSFDAAVDEYREAAGLFIDVGMTLQAIASKISEWQIVRPSYHEGLAFHSALREGTAEDIPLHNFFAKMSYPEITAASLMVWCRPVYPPASV
jgi:hypothetical protein